MDQLFVLTSRAVVNVSDAPFNLDAVGSSSPVGEHEDYVSMLRDV